MFVLPLHSADTDKYLCVTPEPPEPHIINSLWIIIPQALIFILVIFCEDYETE